MGMYAGLLATASLPQYADDEYLVAAPQAAGLATGSLYAEDVCGPREIVDGHLAVEQLVQQYITLAAPRSVTYCCMAIPSDAPDAQRYQGARRDLLHR